MEDKENKLTIEELVFAGEYAEHGCFLTAARVAFKNSGYADNYLRSGKFKNKIMNKAELLEYITRLRNSVSEKINKEYEKKWNILAKRSCNYMYR